MKDSTKIFFITLAVTTVIASLLISKNISIPYDIYSTDIYAGNISKLLHGDARENINRPKRSVQNVIEGYTNKEAYSIGETIHFHVSTSQPTYSISIRLDRRPPGVNLISSEELPGNFYSTPINGWLGANWPIDWSFEIPEHWESDAYVAIFTSNDGSRRYHPFTIHPNANTLKKSLALLANHNTIQAYNYWGGKSMYYWTTGQGYASEVSFQRPYIHSQGLGITGFANGLLRSWLELNNYDYDVLSERLLHENPCILDEYDVVLLSNHHEYLSSRTFDALEMHAIRGGHQIYLSANDLAWQTRHSEDGTKITCFRGLWNEDPYLETIPCHVTRQNPYSPINRPEDVLKAVRTPSFGNGSWFEDTDFIVETPNHWIFDGLNLSEGDTFGNILAAGEQDMSTQRSPQHDVLLRGTRTVFQNPANPPDVDHVESIAAYFSRTPEYGFPDGNGGMMFLAGTISSWSLALQNGAEGREEVSQVLQNILNRMLNSPPPPSSPCTHKNACEYSAMDTDNDGTITVIDLLAVLKVFGLNTISKSDFNADGIVNTYELLQVLSHYGEDVEPYNSGQ